MKIIELGFWTKKMSKCFSHLESLVSSTFSKFLQVFYFLDLVKIIDLGFCRKNVKVFFTLRKFSEFYFSKNFYKWFIFWHLVKTIELGFVEKMSKYFSHLESLVSFCFSKFLQVFYFLTLSENCWVGFLRKKCKSVFTLRK